MAASPGGQAARGKRREQRHTGLHGRLRQQLHDDGRRAAHRVAGSDALEDQRAVGAAEAEVVLCGDVDLHRPRLVGAVVQVALGVLLKMLIVGGTTWSRTASAVNTDSMPPAPPSRWPVMDLVELMTMFLA